ncbi:hypothetical protein JHK82_043420 [Glycine max]|nr:hypothetical protein JHK82_043420 [Glycine max]
MTDTFESQDTCSINDNGSASLWSPNEIQLGNQRFENGFFDQSREFGYLQSNLVPTDTPSSSSVWTHEEPSPEDCEFSDGILSYISQILMEEDMEDKTCMRQDSLDLQIAERSFYEVIGEKYPSTPLGHPSSVDPDDGSGEHNLSENYGTCSYNDGDLSSIFTNNFLRRNLGELPNQNFRGNSISQSSYSSSNSVKSSVEGPVDSPSSILQPRVGSDELPVKVEKDEGESFPAGSKIRKHHHMEEEDVEENRSSKQAAIFSEPTLRSSMIDIILLHSLGDAALTLCGDGNQRLAHIFADGLEARLAGTGSQIYKGLVSKRTSAADFLKAYHLYLAACPFRKMTAFISNVTIRKSSANSPRLHIIDFGILYGFQWPTLIQRLSLAGGAPKLRITGIDFPQPGFRPAERIVETGCRLAAYAESFKVEFEYNAIAKKWETIQLEELKIDRDEYLVVTCFYRCKNVLDESVVVDSPRNKFLSLIRKVNPNIFIHGITNGAFNAPFFVTRFREALFHYSSLFDMLETIVPREEWERMLIEKEIFGREALNVIACEGCERVERPETYRQWQARILRAGFLQQPFEREIVKRAIEKVTTSYHKDFVIDEDSQWLLQGWKGRIIYALSCWKPA